VKFIKIVQQAGMHMILRIGPFVAAEWNYGGVPVWLHYVPGTVFRADNEPWKVRQENIAEFVFSSLLLKIHLLCEFSCFSITWRVSRRI
jgi:hypothetical protein